MIEVVCSCGAGYRVPDDKAGMAFTCKKCRQPVAVQSKPATEGDPFLDALNQLERNAPATIREMDRKEFKQLSSDLAERALMEEEAEAARLEEMSRLAWPSVRGARHRAYPGTSRTGGVGEAAVGKTADGRRSGLDKSVSTLQSITRELRYEILSRIFLHPAIVCGVVAGVLHQKAGKAIRDVSVQPRGDPSPVFGIQQVEMTFTVLSEDPEYVKAGYSIIVFSVLTSLAWLIRGWGRFFSFPDSVKSFTVFTTFYLWCAAAFILLWPWAYHGAESVFLQAMDWIALGIVVLVTLWGAAMILMEDGVLRLLAFFFFTPYSAYCLFFGRPAVRMALIGILGSGFVSFGIGALASLHNSYPSPDAAMEGLENRERDLAFMKAKRQGEKEKADYDAWRLRQDREKQRASSPLPPIPQRPPQQPPPPPVVPPIPPQQRPPRVATPPRHELKKVEGIRGEAVINSLADGKFVHTDQEVSLLGDYVAEGAFEFRPPRGFVRHALPVNPKGVRWEARGARPGEHSILMLTYRREPGRSLDGYFASDGWMVQFTRDGVPMNMNHREGRRFDRNNLTFLRFMPEGGNVNPQGLAMFHVFAVEQDHIIHFQAGMRPERYMQDRKLLEASIATLRRR